MEILQILVIACIPLVSLWLIWSGWCALKQQSVSAPATPPSRIANEETTSPAGNTQEAINTRLPPFLHFVYYLLAKVSRVAIQEVENSGTNDPWPLFVGIMMMALGMFGLVFAFFLLFAR